MKILHQALHENVYAKISLCSNAKDILNTLDSIYLTNESCEFVDDVHKENKEDALKESSHASSEESSNPIICFMANEEDELTSTSTLINDIENDHECSSLNAKNNDHDTLQMKSC